MQNCNPDHFSFVNDAAALFLSGDAIELRALDVPSGNRRIRVAGFFDNAAQCAIAAMELDSRGAKGVYVTLNPIRPELLSRRRNGLIHCPNNGDLTSDKDIIKRTRLLIDVDPQRPANISSSDSEHEAAIQRATDIGRDLVKEHGWPRPVLADSGNGAQLLFAIDLPTKDNGLVKRVLQGLDLRWSDEAIGVDTAVHNPSRICKLYGTTARKGDNEPERPHRQSRVISAPAELLPVSREQLEAVAMAEQAKGYPARGKSDFDIEQWIADRGLSVRGPVDWQGGRKWIIPECPWNPEHNHGEAYILEMNSGAIAAGCHHNSCSSKRWEHLRDELEPGWRDRKARLTEEDALRMWHEAAGAGDVPGLIFDDKGKPCVEPYNLAVMLRWHPDWRGSLTMDEFAARLTWPHAPKAAEQDIEPGRFQDHNVVPIQAWVRREYGISFSSSRRVMEAVAQAAHWNRWHPVRSYLEALTWDGKDRVTDWLHRYMGAELSAINNGIGRMFLTSAVARIFRPGCQADYILNLEGRQGTRKSSAVRALAGEWYQGTIGDLRNKDSRLALQGYWIVEIAELDSLRGQAATRVKDFLTQTIDVYRPPYGAQLVDRPRQCVFIGTTNEDTYLTDPTGGRRFWPVSCGQIDVDAIKADRDQLWAQTVQLYRDGTKWWPSEEESMRLADLQEERYAGDAWEERISKWLMRQPPGFSASLSEIMDECLNLDEYQQTHGAGTRVGSIMARLGWKRRRVTETGIRKSKYFATEVIL